MENLSIWNLTYRECIDQTDMIVFYRTSEFALILVVLYN